MKKVSLMALAAAFVGFTAFAGSATTHKMLADTAKTKKAAKVVYTCPMHSDVVSNKPGKCSKCGMALVKKDAAKKKTDKMAM